MRNAIQRTRLYEQWVRRRAKSEAILALPPPPGGLRISYGPDPLQFGELRLPNAEGPYRVAVVIHGGFWRARYDLLHISRLCEALSHLGLATWSLEYRRVGNPGGGFPGTFLDISAGLDHLRVLAIKHNLDLANCVVLGHSAGGHLAIWSAGRSRIPHSSPIHTDNPLRVGAAVSLAGVLDLRQAHELNLSSGAVDELMGGSPAMRPEQYAAASPIELVPLGVSQYLFHGLRDDVVPISQSEDYYSRAKSAGDPVTLSMLDGVGHFELIDPKSPAWPHLAEIVKRAVELPA